MSEQVDAYSLYEAGTRELLNRIGQDHHLYYNALVYQHRLSENINQCQLYNETDTLRAERNRIINELNKLAVSALGISFRELCEQIEPSERQNRAKLSPNIVNDPLSQVELHSEGPVWRILKDVKETRTHSNWNETLRLCDHATKWGSNYPDPAGIATAQLYMAEAQAQIGRLKEGTDTAERARKNLEIEHEHHNMILADLLLALLKRKAGQNLEYVYAHYRATRDLCQELESKIEESTQSSKAQFYRRTIEGIQRALKIMDEAILMEASRSCCLNAIPVLRLSDGPDMVFQPSKVINYLTTDEFRIEGHTYLLHPLDKAGSDTLELRVGAAHFALPVLEDDWPSPNSKKDRDLALVRAQVTQKGPGVRWTGENWVAGRFERDEITREICFVVPRRHIIGGEVIEEEAIEKEIIRTQKEATVEKFGYVIGVLKPKGSAEWSPDS